MTKILSANVHPTNGRHPDGLKRQTFHVEYGGSDLLIGPNGAGKTTRGPLVITAALEGLATVPTDSRRPYLGPLPAGTSVTLETSAGPIIRDLSVSKGAAFTEANQRARDLIGIPPTAWDLRDFATGTDGERGKILDAVAKAGGQLESWDAARAIKHVRSIMVEKRDENADEEAWTAPLDKCVSDHGAADDADGAAWLEAALIWATTKQRTWNARQKDAGGHLGQIRQSMVGRPERSREELEAERDDLLQWQAAYRVAEATRKKVEQARDRHLALGKEYGERMIRLAERGASLKVPSKEPSTEIPADVVARLEEARAAMDAPVVSEALDVEEMRSAYIEAGKRAKKAEDARENASQALSAAEHEYAEAKAATREAAVTVQTLSNLMTDDVCVHCGAQDPHGMGESLEAARRDHEAAKAKEAPAHAAAAAAIEARNKAKAAEMVARDEAATAKAGLDRALHAEHARDQVRAARQRELDAAAAAYEREVAAAKARKDAYVQAEEKREAALSACRAEWAEARDKLVAWQDEEAPVVPAPPSAEEVGATTERLAEVARDLKLHDAADHHEADVQAAAEKYQQAHLYWKAVVAMVAAVRQARDDVAAAAYRPIHDAASRLLEGTELPVPYFTSPADYGAEIGGRGRVPYAGLSESEQRITAAALVYALATVAGCPCRLVLLDGLEVVQRDHRAPLVAALTRAQAAGLVDNVVMTMASSPDEDLGGLSEIDGLTIHEIERQAIDLTVVPAPVEEEVPVMNRETSILELAGVGEECPF